MSMSNTPQDSRDLHRALARYRVFITRNEPHPHQVEKAKDLNYDQAIDLADSLKKQLAAEEPHLAGRMSRSLVTLELANGDEVSHVLGYGPDFCHTRAAAALASHLEAKKDHVRTSDGSTTE